jgi:hypothetical protein
LLGYSANGEDSFRLRVAALKTCFPHNTAALIAHQLPKRVTLVILESNDLAAVAVAGCFAGLQGPATSTNLAWQ